MAFVWMILIGFVIGLIAKALSPGRDPGGFLVTSVIGIVGSVLAGFLGRAMGIYAEGQPAGFIASVIGAILLLTGYKMLNGRK